MKRYGNVAAKVGDVSGLTGKKVGITGMIRTYKSKPEIIVKSADQIKVH
jgi:DNA/RNA endonuclease YhcR with UshA esterase domain